MTSCKVWERIGPLAPMRLESYGNPRRRRPRTASRGLDLVCRASKLLSFARGRDLAVIVAHTVRKMLSRGARRRQSSCGRFSRFTTFTQSIISDTNLYDAKQRSRGFTSIGSRSNFDMSKAVFSSEDLTTSPSCKLQILRSSSASAVQKHLADLEFSAFSCIVSPPHFQLR